MIDDLKEQEGVHGICGLGTCRDRAALIGFTTGSKITALVLGWVEDSFVRSDNRGYGAT